MSGVHRLAINSCPNIAGWTGKPCPQTDEPQSSRIHAPRLADKLARDPHRRRLVRELGNISHGLQPCRRKLWRTRQVVRDLPAEQFAVGHSRDRARECLWRQLSQPQRQVGGGRRFCEGTTLDHARESGRRIEPGPRNGQREEQRGKARGEVRYARVARCQGAHRSLEAGMISPKSTFQQIGTPGPPARGQHKIRCHDNSSARADQEAHGRFD